MSQYITLRNQLSESISEFCKASKLPLIDNTFLLVELIVLLSRYQEEGVKLIPEVYMTNDIEALTSMIPYSEKIKIDMADKSEEGIKKILKKSAPLAIDSWRIYIMEKSNELEYGLFRDSGYPLNVLLDEVIMIEDEEFFVVKAFQAASDCVEIRSSKSNFHYIFLNHNKEGTPPPQQYIENLVEKITEEVDINFKESTNTYLHRLFLNSLGQSHGCIIAVTNMKKVPKFLSEDGIILVNPINFGNLVDKLIRKEIKSSYLNSNGSLLKGMLNSDGIILFNNKGCLLGYNFFVKFNATNLVGGARKRAYDTIKSKIGKGICAVFMQSQDGLTDFKGNE